MKTLIAALVAVGCLYAFEACGQDRKSVVGPDPLPASLPIGSADKMLEFTATNAPCWPAISFFYTNNVGEYHQMSYAQDGVTFSSYAAFRQYMLTNSIKGINILKSNNNVVSTIKYVVSITPDPLVATAFSISTNIGMLNALDTNLFSVIQPDWIRAVVPISGLQKFNVRVGCNPSYEYTWTPTGTTQNGTPLSPISEQTQSGFVVLNQWYSVGTYQTRFTITASGRTRVYDQSGAAIVPVTLTMVTPGQVTVNFAKEYVGLTGQTLIQMSTDLVNWTTVSQMPWPTDITNVSVTVDGSLPQAFFQAWSQ